MTGEFAVLDAVRSDRHASGRPSSPMPDGSWLSEFESPAGRLRAWPKRGSATWTVTSTWSGGPLVPPPVELVGTGLSLGDATYRLCERALWPIWLSLYDGQRWSLSLGPAEAIVALRERDDVMAVAGDFEVGPEGATYAELLASGQVRAETVQEAERLLLVAAAVS